MDREFNGTPGGLREPVSLACATKRSLVANPRPSDVKPVAKVRRNGEIETAVRHRAAWSGSGDAPGGPIRPRDFLISLLVGQNENAACRSHARPPATTTARFESTFRRRPTPTPRSADRSAATELTLRFGWMIRARAARELLAGCRDSQAIHACVFRRVRL